MDDRLYSITEVARAFKLRISALRYYEDRGLLRPASRRARVRYYDHAALRSLALLQLWHGDGMMSLDDTALLMNPPHPDRWRETLATRRDALDRQIERLTAAREALDHYVSCPKEDPASCPCLHGIVTDRVNEALERLESRSRGTKDPKT